MKTGLRFHIPKINENAKRVFSFLGFTRIGENSVLFSFSHNFAPNGASKESKAQALIRLVVVKIWPCSQESLLDDTTDWHSLSLCQPWATSSVLSLRTTIHSLCWNVWTKAARWTLASLLSTKVVWLMKIWPCSQNVYSMTPMMPAQWFLPLGTGGTMTSSSMRKLNSS